MAPGRLLRRAIQADMLSSIIFSGPPGTGKTTLARIIANSTRSQFLSLNAVLSGVKEVRAAIAQAQDHRSLYGRKTILFVDEVHRWNKAQQDALLPWVENGTVVLIGATTENPFFEVNSALVSRSRVFQLKLLTREDMFTIAKKALEDPIRGYGRYSVSIDEDALEHLVNISDGDARTLLNALQLAVETTPASFPPPDGTGIHVDLSSAEESIQKKVVLYDKEGDYHFDTISAFIKSIRGSDPDATLYWMARMMRAGEDPHYLFRRMLISASEDIGLADPMALVITESAAAAFDRIGLPEGQFHLTQAALYLATAAKSNSTLGFFDAVRTVEEESAGEVPTHLKDASRDKEGFGHGQGYLYPHAYRDHWVAQAYLPAALRDKTFYHPAGTGYEKRIKDDVERRRELQVAAMLEEPPADVLTFTPESRSFRRWLDRVSARTERRDGPVRDGPGHFTSSGQGDTISDILSDIRIRLFEGTSVQRHDRVFVFDPGQGNLIWEAYRAAPEGLVYGVVPDERSREVVQHAAAELPEVERPQLSVGTLAAPLTLSEEVRFEVLFARDPFTRALAEDTTAHFSDVFARVVQHMSDLLSPSGSCAVAQIVPQSGQRLSELVTFDPSESELEQAVKTAEESVYLRSDSPLVGWNGADIVRTMETNGFAGCRLETRTYRELRTVRRTDIDRWLAAGAAGAYGTILSAALDTAQLVRYRDLLYRSADADVVQWRIQIIYIYSEKE